jgi:c-di-GMP-related signal transduction protein
MINSTIHQQVLARAIKDAAFRQAFVNNPKETLAKEYNVHFPDSVAIRVLEDTSTTFTLVLPSQETAMQELSDAELEAVAGARAPIIASDICWTDLCPASDFCTSACE